MCSDKISIALITGASKGIGFELAKVFAKNGYDLIINSDIQDIKEASSDIRNLGVEVFPVEADLSTKEGVDALYDKTSSIGRPVNVLVLNAGIGSGREFMSSNFDRDLEVMNLNMVYTVYLAKKILKDMIERNEGKVLFTSSVAAEMPAPFNAIYGATKSFIQSFAQAIREEFKETNKNITVTALQPGPTDTNFFERGNMDNTTVDHHKKDDPAEVAQDGFDALMSGKDHIVAGSFKNIILAGSSRIMTDVQRSKVHGQMNKPDELKH